MAAINFQKMRKELISLYERFLESSDSEDVKSDFMIYERDFGGLQVYNDYLKSQPVPKDIESGLAGLSTVFQYGWFKDGGGMFSNEEIVVIAKKILEDLKKEDK